MSSKEEANSIFAYAFRCAITYTAYVVFGLGALLLTFWFLCLRFVVINRRKLTLCSRRATSMAFRMFIRFLVFFKAVEIDFDHVADLKNVQGVFLVANHPTLLDYVFIASQLPEVGCVVKSALFSNFFLRGVVKACDYISNDRSETVLEECRKRIALGEVILLFPEGTRTVPGKPLCLHRGVAQMSLRIGVNIEVLHIKCSETWLTKQSSWYNVPKRRPCVKITRKETVNPCEFRQTQIVEPPIMARRLTKYLAGVLSAEE